MNKQTTVYSYYPPIKRHKLLISATTWMNLKSIMLNERNLTPKITYYIPSFISSSRAGKANIWQNSNQWTLWEEKNDLKWHKRALWNDGNVLFFRGVWVTRVCICQNLSNCIFKIWAFHLCKLNLNFKRMFWNNKNTPMESDTFENLN